MQTLYVLVWCNQRTGQCRSRMRIRFTSCNASHEVTSMCDYDRIFVYVYILQNKADSVCLKSCAHCKLLHAHVCWNTILDLFSLSCDKTVNPVTLAARQGTDVPMKGMCRACSRHTLRYWSIEAILKFDLKDLNLCICVHISCVPCCMSVIGSSSSNHRSMSELKSQVPMIVKTSKGANGKSQRAEEQSVQNGIMLLLPSDLETKPTSSQRNKGSNGPRFTR